MYLEVLGLSLLKSFQDCMSWNQTLSTSGTASDLPDKDAFALRVVSASALSFPYLTHLLMVSGVDVLPFVSGSVC